MCSEPPYCQNTSNIIEIWLEIGKHCIIIQNLNKSVKNENMIMELCVTCTHFLLKVTSTQFPISLIT